MSWNTYRAKGENAGPLTPKGEPPKPEPPRKSAMLATLEAVLKEKMHHDLPGSDVWVDPMPEHDGVLICYFVPNRAIEAAKRDPSRMLEAIVGNTPDAGIKAVAKTSSKRRKMAIGRFRIGKFGR
ncbi:MAG TPA: hypothetical protein VFX15_08720 [Actinomycetes bacterium]|nr:hypothetical protein [Actinomycetes bacterium]